MIFIACFKDYNMSYLTTGILVHEACRLFKFFSGALISSTNHHCGKIIIYDLFIIL